MLAPIDALVCATVAKRPVPDWAFDGLIGLLRTAIDNGLYSEKGRGNSPIGRIESLNRLEARFWAVAKVIRGQGRTPRNAEFYGELSTAQLCEMLFAEYETEPFQLGETDQDAFRAASTLLRTTFAKGSPQVMERAYYDFPRIDDGEFKRNRLLGITLEMLGYDISV